MHSELFITNNIIAKDNGAMEWKLSGCLVKTVNYGELSIDIFFYILYRNWKKMPKVEGIASVNIDRFVFCVVLWLPFYDVMLHAHEYKDVVTNDFSKYCMIIWTAYPSSLQCRKLGKFKIYVSQVSKLG